MSNSVIIKSFPSGIVLHLDKEIPFEELLMDIGDKFRESSGFFKDAKMALSIKGRDLTDQEEAQVLNTITTNSRLRIICLVGEEGETNQGFVKALQQTDLSSEHALNNEGHFYRGTLKNGQILEGWAEVS